MIILQVQEPLISIKGPHDPKLTRDSTLLQGLCTYFKTSKDCFQMSAAAMRSFALLSVLATGALAQSSAYGQCGGTGWTGATTCVSGYICTYQNDWYSQCIPGTASSTATTIGTTTTTVTTSSRTTSSTASASTTAAAGSTGHFKWLGVDESGAEFGSDSYPGTWGTHFIFPSNSSIQVRTTKKKKEEKKT